MDLKTKPELAWMIFPVAWTIRAVTWTIRPVAWTIFPIAWTIPSDKKRWRFPTTGTRNVAERLQIRRSASNKIS